MHTSDNHEKVPQSGVLSAGAISLLRDCVGGRSGERLLIVEEPRGSGYYDEHAPRLAAQVGRSMGMTVYNIEAPTNLDSQQAVVNLLDALRGFDRVVFFARVGDQIRFSDTSGLPPATMCYTLCRDMLDSAFGTACYQGMCAVKAAIDDAFNQASSIHITCPLGTDYRGRIKYAKTTPLEVSLKRFPMLVPRPVPADEFSGKIVLSRFLTGTGSQFYEPYCLSLESDVFAIVDSNCIVRFEGDATQVARVVAHYEDIALRFSIDPWYVHSWHPGIHPGCSFPTSAQTDLMRWSGSAFGNPRLVHFHTCGDYAPGEISWTISDPTIRIDDVTVWQAGSLHPDRVAGGKQVLNEHPNLAALYRHPCRDIGLDN